MIQPTPDAAASLREHLRERFIYEPETGRFLLRNPGGRHRHRKGEPAGTLRPDGYVQIAVRGVTRKAHRMAWLYMTGELLPRHVEIDHIDGDPANNRWSNLRLATSQQNSENTHHAHRDSTTGLLGVSTYKGGPLFRARIFVRGRDVALGVHDTAEAAHEAYLMAKRRLHEFGTL